MRFSGHLFYFQTETCKAFCSDHLPAYDLRILQLITRRQPRGAETFAMQLAGELTAAGHRILVAALYAPRDASLQIPAGVEFINLSDRQPSAVPHPDLLRKIAALVRREQVDLVQANASDNLKYAVLSRLLYRWKAPIVYRNASIMSAWIRSGLHRRIYGKLLRSVEAVASVSHLSAADIKQHFGLPGDRVRRLGIAVHLPAEEASSPPPPADVPPDDPDAYTVIHVGAFTAEKNHAGLLRIVALLRQRVDRPLRLWCVGNGPLLEDLQAANTAPDVHYLGYRTDVERLLPLADLLLLPSLIEGTPGVVLEAQAHGIVPLAYRVGAMQECYPEELYEALTVPKGAEAELAERAAGLLADPERRAAYASRLRDFVAREYAMPAVTRGFEKLYAETIQTYRRGRD